MMGLLPRRCYASDVSEPAQTRTGRNSTSDRTLEILCLFSDERLSLTAAGISRELELPRSTAYRYLQSLIRQQFLESAPDGSFRLGMRVLDLARLARAGYGVSDLALPEMRSLAASHRQTVILTSLIGRSVVCLEREEWTGRFLRLSYEPGLELPINAGASALALLAWRPRAEVDRLLERPLQGFTAKTLTTAAAIRDRLVAIRERGEAVSHAEVDPEALGLAVPILDGGGVAAAALSIVAPQGSMSGPQVARALEDLHAAAARIAKRLQLAA